ncbi:hypothetical protein RUMGNA_03715 [Mediterraneibacter gnavus ATCC 29149]|nr:hypothetical protein RUMGNA_03715 [Mediterraneibacter gnavus ATCC 29149]
MDPIIRKSRLISIHTPAKGVTCDSNLCTTGMFDFNPHSREGSDWKSIRSLRLWTDFNPHSREGSDLGCVRIHNRT